MINSLKKALETLGQGLLFGLGFGIAAWILYFAFQAKTQEPPPYRGAVDSITAAPTKENKFVFSNVEEVTRNGRSYFIGSVKNNGTSAVRGINIEVNLFAKNKFVDQYSTYVSAEIGPGEERYFKISCGCKDEPPAPHDSYKIAVVGGY